MGLVVNVRDKVKYQDWDIPEINFEFWPLLVTLSLIRKQLSDKENDAGVTIILSRPAYFLTLVSNLAFLSFLFSFFLSFFYSERQQQQRPRETSRVKYDIEHNYDRPGRMRLRSVFRLASRKESRRSVAVDATQGKMRESAGAALRENEWKILSRTQWSPNPGWDIYGVVAGERQVRVSSTMMRW